MTGGAGGLASPRPRAAAGERRIHVVQGEYRVTDEPDVVLTTLLGSCVAMCLRDPVAGLGGMNHFLLPGEAGAGPRGSGGPGASGGGLRYGAHAMELLVNGVLRDGGRRERLEAKLFGGARMLEGLTDVGEQNADFAERYLRREGIAFAGGSLRGTRGRRVQFWPVCGRARQMTIEDEADLFAAERRHAAAPAPPGPSGQGDVELF